MKRLSLSLVVGIALAGVASVAVASRNSSGTYSPTVTGTYPVVPHTTISSVTFNSLVSDLGAEITDSASRSGKGGFLAPIHDRGYLVPNWFEVALFFPGTTSANQLLARIAFTNSTTIASGLTNARFYVGTTSTGSPVFTLNKRSGATVTGIGTLTYTVGNTAPTISFSSTVTFAAGDMLEVVAPASPDATLADLTITIQAQRL